jgi:2-iminobutanoate/2-iminopropanoate deaminase
VTTPNRTHNPASLFPPYVAYAHAVEVPPGARTLYVSGLNGFDPAGGTMPVEFADQIVNVWDHLENVLRSADMTVRDVVSLRFFLTSADFDPLNVAELSARLGEHRSARTVVVQQLLEPDWLVEVEAIAARVD